MHVALVQVLEHHVDFFQHDHEHVLGLQIGVRNEGGEVVPGLARVEGVAEFAAERFGVTPDMICFAKAVNSGTVPMGGVIARKGIYDTFMKGPDHAIELFHGYTYSGHPLAAAAALATLDLYRDEKLFERTKAVESRWMDAVMGLKGLPNVLDIRTIGLVAAIDLASIPDGVGRRAYEAMDVGFREHGIMLRITADTIALTPPLIISDNQIDELIEKVKKCILAVA
jgi:beta-alanine--pyruvate transaminase